MRNFAEIDEARLGARSYEDFLTLRRARRIAGDLRASGVAGKLEQAGAAAGRDRCRAVAGTDRERYSSAVVSSV
jgi:hypothetical protein